MNECISFEIAQSRKMRFIAHPDCPNTSSIINFAGDPASYGKVSNKQWACPRFRIVVLSAHQIQRNKSISSLARFKQKAALHFKRQWLLADALRRYEQISATEL